MTNEPLNNSVRLARVKYGFSQSDLAAKVDVTRQTIASIEKGDYSPSVLLALKLASALSTPLNELFWLEEK